MAVERGVGIYDAANLTPEQTRDLVSSLEGGSIVSFQPLVSIVRNAVLTLVDKYRLMYPSIWQK